MIKRSIYSELEFKNSRVKQSNFFMLMLALFDFETI